MWSRNGKQIISAPHIFESLAPLFSGDPSLIFDGELYSDALSSDFNRIVSLVRKSKPKKEDLEESRNIIQYHIYDLPSLDEGFIKRFKELCHIYDTNGKPKYCRIVKTTPVKNQEEMDILYGHYLDEGYEGQMLRHAVAYYENKRCKYLLKRKTFTDEEFKILDICEGVGNRTGTAGYMVFERLGQKFNSNIKCTFEEGVDILKNRGKLIGKSATVKYFNLTPAGIPRFPYVTNIAREDYE
jgi:DNA ligase-1